MKKYIDKDWKNFVDEYEEELLEMLIDDLKKKEIWNYIKICDKYVKKIVNKKVNEILSNDIKKIILKKNSVKRRGEKDYGKE